MIKQKVAFMPISKKETQADGTIKVWGCASSEALDCDGDTILSSAMAAAMPEYMKFGNIREMHGPSAAGVAFEYAMLEDGKTWLGAHIVDPVAVKKVQTETYKGFSIGGDATGTDPQNPKIITSLVLNEISLVDRPANPDAVFQLWKARAMTPTTKPEELTPEQAIDEIAVMLTKQQVSPQVLLAMAKAAGQTKPAEPANTAFDATASAVKAAQEEAAAKAAPATVGGEVGKVAGAEDDDDDDMEKFTKAADSDKPYGDVDYADPGYQDDGKKRYPIDTEEHIRAAWNYINKEKNAAKYSADEVKKIKAKIVAAWKDKIDSEGPPSADGTDKEKAVGTAQQLNKGTAVTDNNGTALEYPKTGEPVMLKEGDFTMQATVVDFADGLYTLNTGTMEVTVNQSKLVIVDAPETPIKWYTTMDQAEGISLKKKAVDGGALQKVATGGELKKGMYDIIDFAYILMDLKCLQSCVAYEQYTEGDTGSKVKPALDAWIEDGKKLMMTIVSEEVGEMGEGKDVDVDIVVAQKAAQSGILRKGLGLFLENSGAEAIAAMSEFCASKAPVVEPTTETVALEKAVKSGDLGAVQKAVDAAANARVAPLEKALGALQKTVDALAAQPAPAKGVLRAVTKGADMPEDELSDITPVVGADNKVDPVATALKKAYANPNTLHFGGGITKAQ